MAPGISWRAIFWAATSDKVVGFLVLSDEAIFQYKCDNFYNKESEDGIAWDDKTINIDSIQDEEYFLGNIKYYAYQSFAYDDVIVKEDDYYREISQIG